MYVSGSMPRLAQWSSSRPRCAALCLSQPAMLEGRCRCHAATRLPAHKRAIDCRRCTQWQRSYPTLLLAVRLDLLGLGQLLGCTPHLGIFSAASSQLQCSSKRAQCTPVANPPAHPGRSPPKHTGPQQLLSCAPCTKQQRQALKRTHVNLVAKVSAQAWLKPLGM
jgi:hypothetical protein